MPWSIADTDYSQGHPWDSLFNGVPGDPAVRQSPLLPLSRAEPGVPG
jgi:hypothetical protein